MCTYEIKKRWESKLAFDYLHAPDVAPYPVIYITPV
jgi:hypothetical protein